MYGSRLIKQGRLKDYKIIKRYASTSSKDIGSEGQGYQDLQKGIDKILSEVKRNDLRLSQNEKQIKDLQDLTPTLKEFSKDPEALNNFSYGVLYAIIAINVVCLFLFLTSTGRTLFINLMSLWIYHPLKEWISQSRQNSLDERDIKDFSKVWGNTLISYPHVYYTGTLVFLLVLFTFSNNWPFIWGTLLYVLWLSKYLSPTHLKVAVHQGVVAAHFHLESEEENLSKDELSSEQWTTALCVFLVCVTPGTFGFNTTLEKGLQKDGLITPLKGDLECNVLEDKPSSFWLKPRNIRTDKFKDGLSPNMNSTFIVLKTDFYQQTGKL